MSDATNDIDTAIFGQSTRNYFERLGNSPASHLGLFGLKGSARLIGPLGDAFNAASTAAEKRRYSHLSRTATREEARLQNDVASNVHGILKVAFNLVQHILIYRYKHEGEWNVGRRKRDLRSATQDNRACLGIVALDKVGKVLVANLANFKQATA